MPPTIVIVGRENVGKSTLFNRLSKKRDAITDKEPGITRDYKEKEIQINHQVFTLIDTGGYISGKLLGIKRKVREKILTAITKADLVLLVVDGKLGFKDEDKELSDLLRKENKKVILVVNKIDIPKKQGLIFEFYKLGFEEILPISAIHGLGIPTLISTIIKYLPRSKYSPRKYPRFAIIGKPNVGKSTYLNALLNEDRVIVDPTPSTTIDSLEVLLHYNSQPLLLIDTPGIMRKPSTSLSFYSLLRATRAIELSDVVLLLIDGSSHFTKKDKQLLKLSIDYLKGVVLVVNKIDKGVIFREEELKFANYIPILYISALQGEKIFTPIEEGLKIYKERKKFIPYKELKTKLLPYISSCGVKTIVQLSTSPPVFRFKSKEGKLSTEKLRFIERKIREQFGFVGVPLKVKS
jgi:GTP-binding protein